jgi:hypothetical protein
VGRRLGGTAGPRRLGGGILIGGRDPTDAVARGCELRGLLPDLAVTRCAAGVDRRQQCRSAPPFVRLDPGGRRRGADPDRRATASLLLAAVIYRPLVVECFDRGFLRAVGGRGGLVHTLFLALVVFNLVAGSQALGTLMGRRTDDAARRRALLGARVVISKRGEQRIGARLGISRPAIVLSPRPAFRAGDRPVHRLQLSRLSRARPARQPARALCSGARISRLEPDTKKGRDRRASAQTCQVGPGLPMLPPPMTLVPFISQMAACPSVFCHRMSEYPLS